MSKLLKGSKFFNRYRITGQITTSSPLHIGTGDESDTRLQPLETKTEQSTAQTAPLRELSLAERVSAHMGIAEKKSVSKNASQIVPKVSTIIKDHKGKPLIPGSSLRGVIRHWLLDILRGIPLNWAATRDYTNPDLVSMPQLDQVDKVLTEFSLLELIFGTPFNAGKVELWDAICTTESLDIEDRVLGWNPNSLTYIDTSVAIDPDTGTALEHLLYQTEVVPPGVTFEFNLVGHNLSDIELGLILLGLQGFNSAIYPVRLGARNGRGYGRVTYSTTAVYCLEQSNVPSWISGMIASMEEAPTADPLDELKGNAGYFALPRLTETRQHELIADVKSKLQTALSEV